MIRGATNILVFAWEFDELPMADGWPHPFSDRRAMINRFDEIWMPSQHSASVMANLTRAPVYCVPSPVLPRPAGRRWRNGAFERGELARHTLADNNFVPLSVFPQFQGDLTDHAKREAQPLWNIIRRVEGRPKIFLTIANPHDRRKNLRPLIEAFADYARGHPEAILLIKTSAFDFTTDTINRLIFTHQLARDDESLEAFVSKSIWICNDSLDDDDLDELYAIVDFYICTPTAEGQNLPLLEAMLRGCVAVAPRHTAMLDYITQDNAVVIGSRRGTPPEDLRRTFGLRNADIDIIEAADVGRALLEAGALTDERKAHLASAGRDTVRSRYSAAGLLSQWARLLHMVPSPVLAGADGV